FLQLSGVSAGSELWEPGRRILRLRIAGRRWLRCELLGAVLRSGSGLSSCLQSPAGEHAPLFRVWSVRRWRENLRWWRVLLIRSVNFAAAVTPRRAAVRRSPCGGRLFHHDNHG